MTEKLEVAPPFVSRTKDIICSANRNCRPFKNNEMEVMIIDAYSSAHYEKMF